MILNSPYISGSSTITGNLNVLGTITGSTNSAISASYANNATSASYALNATSASYALVATSASYSNNSTSASYSNNSTSASYALAATSASYALASTSASYAANSDLLDGRDSLTFANTSSNNFVGTQNINGSVAITGSLTTTGAITAQTLNVQQVTSSIVYSSGSNIFGNSVSNTQSMTGSVGISGSLAVTGASTVTGVLTLNSTISNGTYTYTLPSATGTLALTSALSSYLPLAGGTLTGALILSAANNQVRSGNEIRFYRTDNAIYTQLYDGGGTNGFVIDNRNGDGFNFQSAGTSQFRIASTGAATFTIPVESPALGTVCLTAKTSNGANDIFRWYDGTTQLGVFKNNGSVGIGTASPPSKFSVEWDKSTAFAGAAIYDSQAYNAANHAGILAFGGKYTSAGAYTEWAAIGGIKSNTTDNDYAGDLVAYTRPNGSGMTERMRITSGGNVGIGTASPTGQVSDNRVLQIYGAGTGNRAQIHLVNSNTGEASTDGTFLSIDSSGEFFIVNKEAAATVFENNGSERMRITSGGDVIVKGSLANFTLGSSGAEVFFGRNATNYITANGGAGSTIRIISNTNGVELSNGATSWVAVSDENVKVMAEWKTFINPLEKIISLRAGTSRYKTDSEDISRSFLIAQDVQKVLPEAVSVDEDGILGLRYTEVIPLMIAAIQELNAKITELENK